MTTGAHTGEDEQRRPSNGPDASTPGEPSTSGASPGEGSKASAENESRSKREQRFSKSASGHMKRTRAATQDLRRLASTYRGGYTEAQVDLMESKLREWVQETIESYRTELKGDDGFTL